MRMKYLDGAAKAMVVEMSDDAGQYTLTAA